VELTIIRGLLKAATENLEWIDRRIANELEGDAEADIEDALGRSALTLHLANAKEAARRCAKELEEAAEVVHQALSG